MSIKAKTVFQLIPVGPFKEKGKFMEKKRQFDKFESSLRNHNHDYYRRKFD